MFDPSFLPDGNERNCNESDDEETRNKTELLSVKKANSGRFKLLSKLWNFRIWVVVPEGSYNNYFDWVRSKTWAYCIDHGDH